MFLKKQNSSQMLLVIAMVLTILKSPDLKRVPITFGSRKKASNFRYLFIQETTGT